MSSPTSTWGPHGGLAVLGSQSQSDTQTHPHMLHLVCVHGYTSTVRLPPTQRVLTGLLGEAGSGPQSSGRADIPGCMGQGLSVL